MGQSPGRNFKIARKVMQRFPPYNGVELNKADTLSVPLSAAEKQGGNCGLSRVGKAHLFTLDNPQSGMDVQPINVPFFTRGAGDIPAPRRAQTMCASAHWYWVLVCGLLMCYTLSQRSEEDESNAAFWENGEPPT